MFSNLGLLKTASCPEKSTCQRIRCLFSHEHQSRPNPKAKATGSSSRSAVQEPAEVTRKRSIGSAQNGHNASPLAKKRTAPVEPVVAAERAQAIKRAVQGQASPSKPKAPAKPSLPPSPAPVKVTAQPVPGPSTLVPIVSKNAKVSPHPWADRQKGLRTLHTQYEKLYANIPGVSPELAKQSAIEQELDISTASANLAAYKRAVHHAAVSVSRREKPDSVSHPSVGTMKESKKATEQAEKDKASRLTADRIERYLLPVSDFEKWRYPLPDDDELVNPPDMQPDLEGTVQTCHRCKKEFTISSANLEGRMGECHFHHGRLAPDRIEGRRKWIYSCCRRERGEAGCEEGVHVFSDGDNDRALAKRVAYVKVGQAGAGGTDTGSVVLAMDCEMISTTAGSSLARLTIVDESGTAVLDELVRQHAPILDVNTRFSGITLPQLDSAVMDIQAVRAAALMFIGPDTVLVGHGLENDLRALRILHTRVIDTAILFPHDKGHPYRRALRDIVKEKLGIFIQDRTADHGHSSAEDAKAALDLLKWKVRDDRDD